MYIDNTIINEWVDFLKNRDYSENTIQNYTTDLKLFLNFIRLKKADYTITENDINFKMIENRKTYLR
jgi:site-specific recombinase XerD